MSSLYKQSIVFIKLYNHYSKHVSIGWIFNKVQKKVLSDCRRQAYGECGMCYDSLSCSTNFEGVNKSKLVFLAQAAQHKINNRANYTLLHYIIGMRCKTRRFHGDWKW